MLNASSITYFSILQLFNCFKILHGTDLLKMCGLKFYLCFNYQKWRNTSFMTKNIDFKHFCGPFLNLRDRTSDLQSDLYSN